MSFHWVVEKIIIRCVKAPRIVSIMEMLGNINSFPVFMLLLHFAPQSLYSNENTWK